MGEVDAARANLQTILDNLTAGVIVLDAQGVIQSTNPGATRILRAPLAAYEGQPLAEVPGLEDFAHERAAAVRRLPDRTRAARPRPLAAVLRAATPRGDGMPQRRHQPGGARRRAARRRTRLLVFDDISEIVSAQRAQAWGEVARRLAHEIKNPLTPIQLSAERLEMKLSGKVAPPEQAILTNRSRPSSTRSTR